jgi:choline kinase
MTVSDREFVGVLLAAGMGKRLAPASGGRPKVLVSVAGQPLLAYGVAFLRAVGVTRTVIVGGFGFEAVAEASASIAPGATLVRNDAYEDQNAVSLLLALRATDADALVCDADYIRSVAMAECLADAPHALTLYVSSATRGEEDSMRIAFGEDGSVTALAKGLPTWDAVSAGMLFVPRGARDALIAAAERAIAEKGARTARLEDALVVAARAGTPLMARDVGASAWLEIDTPEDLAVAGTRIAAEPATFIRP